ncbi:hypothetical protein C7B76_20205 [filamentous cyanobacterium CCP2]|nr:hypothetical protein C7B76_20205 [filamentous cyanobacterium CCP2]
MAMRSPYVEIAYSKCKRTIKQSKMCLKLRNDWLVINNVRTTERDRFRDKIQHKKQIDLLQTVDKDQSYLSIQIYL